MEQQTLVEIERMSKNIRRDLDKARIIEELLVHRKIPMDALKLYCLFLRRYFSIQRQEFDAAFYSRTKLCNFLRGDAKKIQKIQDELNAAQNTKDNPGRRKKQDNSGRRKKQVFLSTNQAHLLEMFKLLIEDKQRRLIARRDRDVEFTIYPEVFDHLKLDKRTTTWAQTLQPIQIWFSETGTTNVRDVTLRLSETGTLKWHGFALPISKTGISNMLEASREDHTNLRDPLEILPVLEEFFNIPGPKTITGLTPETELVSGTPMGCYFALEEIGLDPELLFKLAQDKEFKELVEKSRNAKKTESKVNL